MHDEKLHSYHEDSDIFNRFILNGYDIIQTWEALVYHLTCRGGQFQDGIEQVTKDEFFHLMKNSSFKNYVRKWGTFIKNDEYQYPTIPHKYNVGIHIKNCNKQILNIIEPWGTNVFVDLNQNIIEEYIQEQYNSIINLNEKINNSAINNDIELIIDGNKLTNQNINFIFILSEILDDNQLEVGKYQFDIFDIKVNRIKHTEEELIIVNNG